MLRQIKRRATAEGNGNIDRQHAVAVCPIATDRSVHAFMLRRSALHSAIDGGAENRMHKARLVFVRRDTADIFIHKCRKVGKHMMVMRAGAVPALPERCRAEVYPPLTAGERSLRNHPLSDVSFARSPKRLHDELVSENAEVKMPVALLYLRYELFHKRDIFLRLVKPEIKHCARCRLAVALDGKR